MDCTFAEKNQNIIAIGLGFTFFSVKFATKK